MVHIVRSLASGQTGHGLSERGAIGYGCWQIVSRACTLNGGAGLIVKANSQQGVCSTSVVNENVRVYFVKLRRRLAS